MEINKMLEKIEELSRESRSSATVLDALRKELESLKERKLKNLDDDVENSLRERLMELFILVKSTEMQTVKEDLAEKETEILEITKKLKQLSRENIEKDK